MEAEEQEEVGRVHSLGLEMERDSGGPSDQSMTRPEACSTERSADSPRRRSRGPQQDRRLTLRSSQQRSLTLIISRLGEQELGARTGGAGKSRWTTYACDLRSRRTPERWGDRSGWSPSAVCRNRSTPSPAWRSRSGRKSLRQNRGHVERRRGDRSRQRDSYHCRGFRDNGGDNELRLPSCRYRRLQEEECRARGSSPVSRIGQLPPAQTGRSTNVATTEAGVTAPLEAAEGRHISGHHRKMTKKRGIPSAVFLIGFLVPISYCYSCRDLHCFVDYIDTLTCKYTAFWDESLGISYELIAEWISEDEDLDTVCHLVQSESKHKQTCNVNMISFGAEDIFNISINKRVYGKYDSNLTCGPFFLSENFVPAAPFNLTVSFSENYNISWRTFYETLQHYLKHGELEYQLSYKKAEDSWKNEKFINILEDEKNVLLLKASFQGEAEFVARVRTKPRNMSIYRGGWSEWSDTVTWRTPADGISSNFQMWTALPIVALSIIIILCYFKQPQWLWKNVWVFIPNPAPFFKPLYVGHNGDFKSWLGYPYNMTLPFDGRVVIPEVHLFTSILNPALDEQLLPSKTCLGKCKHFTGSRNIPFDHIFIDTVTVTDEGSQSYSQCLTNSILQVDSYADDCYPSVSLDSDHEHLLGLLPKEPNTVNSTRNHKLEFNENLRSNINILDLISIPPEEWESQAPSSHDDENVFYNDEHYDSFSPSSGNSEDFGYPRICLDLDTIDSGFVDSECSSPVESEFENCEIPPKLSLSESFDGQGDACQRNYVKQWVPCNSTIVNGSNTN
ncbi:interleukin-21 receptor [Discoglossus pictus]